MATVQQYGSITPTLGVNHIVGTVTSPAVYVFSVDLSSMTLGDVLELRANRQLTAGTIVNFYSATYANRQANGGKDSTPMPVNAAAHFQIRQTAGVPRNFPFEITSV